MAPHTVNWEKIDWTPVRQGMERKSFSGEGATLALHRIQPGHALLPHSHHFEQVVYMLQGVANFHIGEDVCRLEPGGLVVIPPNITHFIEVTGSETALELDVFTPMRSEYGG